MNIEIPAPSQGAPMAWPLPAAATPSRLEATWAREDGQLRAAQALRWRVLVAETGARPSPPAGTPAGLDADFFDAHCEHLLLHSRPDDGSAPELVATYRLLTPAAARLVGGLHSEGAFDLLRLRRLRPRMAEVGRACIAPGWRDAATAQALWDTLAAFLRANELECALGSAVVALRDGGILAAALYRHWRSSCPAPLELQVRPRLPLPLAALDPRVVPRASALAEGWIARGARLLGAPAWDAEFGSAELPLLLAAHPDPAR
ncbi:MAG: GNAT family N-acetyltransferase [Burkholderiales bacterium]|nr:GNAT family N-acetyltransferase [Burkholderiales bacterium]MDE2158477.1 GNAT family N-acetyltransferase [Burkholderiales bacterium]